MNEKFDFKDITIIPETLSTINSRSEINVHNSDGYLPLIVSPMDTVIDEHNAKYFNAYDMLTCLPRRTYDVKSYSFKSISLDEFEWMIDGGVKSTSKYLVDIANGHMQKLYDLCKKYISLNGGENLMIGNIANPKTYEKFAELGVGYIRVGIGGGSGCLTSANTGVHYPMASLIDECYTIKKKNEYQTKIVADGGFKNYDDIIKAICLGADYVMLGGILNKTLESCSDTKLFNKIKISYDLANKIWKKYPFMRKYFYKEFRGMSTKAVQRKWGRGTIKTSEGVHRTNKVEYTLPSWVENFTDYLKTAMSYTNSKDLESFRDSQVVFITENALNRYNK